MAKRDTGFGNTRYTEEEELWLRSCAKSMDMTASEMVRKCLALGIPQLLGNPFLRRVELKDTMGDWKPSVKN